MDTEFWNGGLNSFYEYVRDISFLIFILSIAFLFGGATGMFLSMLVGMFSKHYYDFCVK
jgi:hypothetical protein